MAMFEWAQHRTRQNGSEQKHVQASIAAIQRGTSPHPLQQLQQMIGNQAVQALLESKHYDRLGHRRFHGLMAPGRGGDMSLSLTRGRKGSEAFRRTGSQLPREIRAVVDSSGVPLESGLRARAEARFAQDFGAVRLHTGPTAMASTRSVNAAAYTVGDQVVLGVPESQLHTHEGRRLLAHELAHVVQQRRGGKPPSPLRSSRLEHAAARAALAFESGGSRIDVSGACAPGFARQPRALNQSLNVVALSDEELEREVRLIREWLLDNPGSSPDHERLRATLRELEAELAGRRGSQLPTAGEAVRDVAMGAGTVAEVEAILRTLYQRVDAAIVREAEHMLARAIAEGADPTAARQSVARWVVKARNQAKVRIRRWDLDVLRLLAEESNRRIYGHPIGPSYEQLRYGDPARNIRPRTDAEIIEGARRTRPPVNKWVGRLRIAGRIMIAIDIGISAWTVATAPEVDRPRVFLRELGGLVGAAGGGWGGAKLGGAIGAGIGAGFGGAGAVPGAAIGAVIGGLAGAIGGGWAGRKAGEFAAELLYPPAETRFEGGFR